jgi:phage gp36-like protein
MPLQGRYITGAELYVIVGGTAGATAVARISGGDVAREQAALDRAEDEAEGFLTVRYVMPEPDEPLTGDDLDAWIVANVPPTLKQYVAAAFKYYLREQTIDGNVPDEIRKPHDDLLRFYDRVRQGGKTSPSVVGLVEKSKDSDVRAYAEQPDASRRPWGTGRFSGLAPSADASGYVEPYPWDPNTW